MTRDKYGQVEHTKDQLYKAATKILKQYTTPTKKNLKDLKAAETPAATAEIIISLVPTLDILQVRDNLMDETEEITYKDRKKEEKKENKPVYTSLILTDDFIAEQVLNDQGTQCYAKYNTKTGKVNYEWQIEHDGQIYSPIMDEEAVKRYVKLPTRAEEYDNNNELDANLDQFIKKWLDIDEFHRKYSVYNIRKSWVYERFHTLNYQKAQGEPGVGKSRYLDVIGGLHYKPILTSGATTSAPIFRIINKWKGTLIIDEADLKHSDETNDTIKIINQGYEKDRCIMRCDPNDNNKVQFFDAYCPKVLATRKTFDDPATESRCMTVIMKSTLRKDIPVNLNSEFYEELQELRNKLLMWRFRNYHKIDPNAGVKVDLGSIEPRLRQVNVGFVSLFADKPEEIKRFKEYLEEYQKELVETRSNTVEGVLVRAFAQLLVDGEPLSPARVVECADLKDKNGNLWRPNRISKYMKTLGFSPAKPRRLDGQVLRVYDFDKDFLVGLVRKYVFDEDLVLKICNDCYARNGCNAVTGRGGQKVLTENIGEISDDQKKASRSLHSVTIVTALHFMKENIIKTGNAIHHNDVLKWAESNDVGVEEVEGWIVKLLERGDIFSPKAMFYNTL